MLKVVSFQQRALRRAVPGQQRRPEPADADIPELVSRLESLQAKAKREIQQAILLLDLAAQHARRTTWWMCDPAARKNVEDQISAIERSLQTAQGEAVKL